HAFHLDAGAAAPSAAGTTLLRVGRFAAAGAEAKSDGEDRHQGQALDLHRLTHHRAGAHGAENLVENRLHVQPVHASTAPFPCSSLLRGHLSCVVNKTRAPGAVRHGLQLPAGALAPGVAGSAATTSGASGDA